MKRLRPPILALAALAVVFSTWWSCSTANAEAGAGALQAAQRAYGEGRFEHSLKLLSAVDRSGVSLSLRSQLEILAALNYIGLEAPQKADDHFRRALTADPTAKLDPTRVNPQTIGRLERIRASLSGTLRVESNARAATVEVNEQRKGVAPLVLRLPIGAHEITVSAANRVKRRRVVVRVNSQTSVLFDFDQQAAPPPTAQPTSTGAPTPRRRRLWTWIAAGAAIGSAAAGLGLMLSAKADFDEYETTNDPSRYDQLSDRIPTKSGVAVGLFAAGGVLAVTSVVLFVYEGRRREGVEPTTALIVGPGSLSLSGRF